MSVRRKWIDLLLVLAMAASWASALTGIVVNCINNAYCTSRQKQLSIIACVHVSICQGRIQGVGAGVMHPLLQPREPRF